MSHWVRLWEDMPNDPKWRVVAQRAKRPASEVLAVFVHMLTNAANAGERGTLNNWNDEDVAIAIDSDPEHVAAIRQAMQGKVLDGNRLTGWDKRQPLREDGSRERAAEWRKKKAAEKANLGSAPSSERTRTQANATKRQRREDESRVDKNRTDSAGPSVPPSLPPAESDVQAGGQAGLSESFKERLIKAVYPEVKDDRDFGPIETLMAAGATEADVLDGIAKAFAKRKDPDEVFQHWSFFIGWIKRAAKDRATGTRKPNGQAPPQGPKVKLLEGREFGVSYVRELHASGKWFPVTMGPAPGKPGCLVPSWVWNSEAAHA